MRHAHYTVAATDGLVLHQANRFVISTVGRKCGFPAEKTPSEVVEQYGNQSSASIPCALIHAFSEPLSSRALKLVLCGYGVGWSWGAVAAEFGPLVVAPIQPYPHSK
jgi:3-oxoacyl-[acyl-carrier-protein] synthase-3